MTDGEQKPHGILIPLPKDPKKAWATLAAVFSAVVGGMAGSQAIVTKHELDLMQKDLIAQMDRNVGGRITALEQRMDNVPSSEELENIKQDMRKIVKESEEEHSQRIDILASRVRWMQRQMTK